MRFYFGRRSWLILGKVMAVRLRLNYIAGLFEILGISSASLVHRKPIDYIRLPWSLGGATSRLWLFCLTVIDQRRLKRSLWFVGLLIITHVVDTALAISFRPFFCTFVFLTGLVPSCKTWVILFLGAVDFYVSVVVIQTRRKVWCFVKIRVLFELLLDHKRVFVLTIVYDTVGQHSDAPWLKLWKSNFSTSFWTCVHIYVFACLR